MPRYVITIQQVIDVEADSEKLAIEAIKANPPYRDLFGAGPYGAYGLKSRETIKIISCVEKQKRSRKHA